MENQITSSNKAFAYADVAEAARVIQNQEVPQ